MKKALEGSDIEAIKSATDKVNELSQTLGAALYAANSATTGDAGADSNSANSSHDEGVQDAEIVDEQ